MSVRIHPRGPTRAGPLARVRRGAALAPILGLALLAGCGLGEDRIEAHLERADTFLAEGRGIEALLELRSAAQLAPDDPSITLRVAETSADYGYEGDAMDFYRDYHALVPDDDARSLTLAQLLRYEAPDEANALIDGVLERDPENSDAWLARAQLALASDDTRAAMRHVRHARSIDPENPEVYWALARTYEARIQAIRRRPGPGVHSPRTYGDALEAYDEYVRKGGERQVTALLHRADLIASLPKRQQQARDAYAMAVRAAAENGSHHERLSVARRASAFARHRNLPELEASALELWLATSPAAIEAWEQLANMPSDDPAAQARKTCERMLRTIPDDPAAHVLYARFLARLQGLGAGLEHLRERLGAELDDAVLLSGILDLQFASGRKADAARTLRELRTRFPDRHETELLAARNLIAERRFEEAIRVLEAANERHETAEGQRMLARTALALGRYADATAAVRRAEVLDRGVSPDNLRLLARILAAQDDPGAAARTLLRISRSEPLSYEDRLMMARAHYDARAGGVGRHMLGELLEIDPTSKRAALEFARRENVQPEMREKARRHVGRALRAHPNDLDLLRAITELDLIDGRIDPALLRIHRAIGRDSRSARLYLLRARVLLSLRRLKEARNDAERALAVDPGAREEALEVLSLVYASSPNPRVGVETLEAAEASEKLSADRLVLLGRLQLQLGDYAAALATYERALAAGSQLTMLKNDLAYLLARTGQDLDRALQLAREASEAPGRGLSAADTLGYVYLRSGQPEPAFWQFRYVTANADPPRADYHYHLALALIALDRESEATESLRRALAIDPQFSDAESARAHLARISPNDAQSIPQAARDEVQPRSG